MKVSVATHTGLVRDANEDRYCIWEAPAACDCSLLAVADGMGGHRAGEVASAMAVEVVRSHLAGHIGNGNSPLPAREQFGELLVEGIEIANRCIFDLAQQRPELAGMGTTFTGLVVAGETVFYGHVGDSRAYIIRNGSPQQLTNDHSLVGEMLGRGHLSENDVMGHPQRHVLTRALGVEKDIAVDTGIARLETGDRIVLATDGLTALITNEEMLQAIEAAADFSKIADRLIDLANARGGRDNITVLVVETQFNR